MDKAFVRSLIMLPVLAGLAACNNPLRLEEPYIGRMDTAGPAPVVERTGFEQIDLLLLLNPEANKGIEEYSTAFQQRQALQMAFDEFYNELGNKVERRNRVQEQILAASQLRCGIYKDHLKRTDIGYNLALGTFTTVTAGLGAILTSLDAVRALAGAAAIGSGVRAELSEAFFQQLTVQVLTDGIELKRARIYDDILTRRQQGLSDYPVEAAIKDAIFYDDHCSLIAGLEEAALAIARQTDPGLRRLAELQQQFPSLADPRVAPSLTAGEDGAASPLTTLPTAALMRAKEQRGALEAAKTAMANKDPSALETRLEELADPRGVTEQTCEERPDDNAADLPLCRLFTHVASLKLRESSLEEELEKVLKETEGLEKVNAAELVQLEQGFFDKQREVLSVADPLKRAAAVAERDALASRLQERHLEYQALAERMRLLNEDAGRFVEDFAEVDARLTGLKARSDR